MNSPGQKTIAVNKRARFEYFIEERLEAGLSLEGWEVKALREGQIQFADSYVLLKDGEAFLFGCTINPLPTTSAHSAPDPLRTRKLLLHRREIDRLTALVDRKGKTVVPTAMYFKMGKVKVEIGVATGKKSHDKRRTQRDRDWDRQKARIMKGR
jgi:SsrA-binding protein